MYAPITLFVYNRPEHTRRTIEALQKNFLAKDSDLIIYSDAPKTCEVANAVHEVRRYIHQIDEFKTVTIVERETHYGLARSIIDGVTTVVKKYGRIIVMEDDLVTSPYFLKFMNDAVNAYKNEEKVMHISGYMFPIDSADLPETFFLRNASCWGWATWSRAWHYFEKNPNKLFSEFSRQTITRFNMDGAYDFWSQVEQNLKGDINTWAIFWYASVFEQGGLCLHPKYSMVSNIGHDGTGVHCDKTDTFTIQLSNKPITYFERNPVENVLAVKKLKALLSPARPTFLSRFSQALKF